jgi:AraC-like DNA-binding protein
MRVIAAPEILSGFLCDAPFDDLPAFTHCGEALANPGAELLTHQHAGFEFLYLVRGSIDWKIDQTVVEQRMGDLFIAYPSEPHRTANKFHEDTYNFWIGLDLEKLGPRGAALAKLLLRERVRLLPHCHAVEPVLRALVGAVVTPLPNQRQVILAYLNVLFALIEQRQKVEASARQSNARTHLPYSYMVQNVISYMKRNLDRRLSLSEMAKIANSRNASYFGYLFRREVGVTPAAHHLQLRLEAARDGLAQPSMDITLVALQYGFSSSQHFSALFRRAFGLTPLKWKRSQHSPKRKKAA